jgi:hypothetical protein
MLVLFCAGFCCFSPVLAVEWQGVLPPSDESVTLVKGWQYRADDFARVSPLDFARVERAPRWTSIASLDSMVFRTGQDFVLMRVRIPEGNWTGASLLLSNSKVSFQAYMSGKLLYPNRGALSESRYARVAQRWHMIPLPSNSIGQYVYFRVGRPPARAPLGTVTVGSRHEHFRAIFGASLWRLVIGIVVILVGVLSALITISRKPGKTLSAFAATSLLIGLHIFASAPLCLEWADVPFIWGIVAHTSLFLIPAFVYRYYGGMLPTEDRSIVHRLALTHFGFAACAVALALLGIVSFQYLLWFFAGVSIVAIVLFASQLLSGLRSTHSIEHRLALVAAFFLLISICEIAFFGDFNGAISQRPALSLFMLSVIIVVMGFGYLRKAIRSEQKIRKTNEVLEKSVGIAVELSSAYSAADAAVKAAEIMVRELQLGSLCNVHLYELSKQRDASSRFVLAQLIVQGRQVGNPQFAPLREKHEAMADQMLLWDAPLVTGKNTLVVPLIVDGEKWGFFTADNYLHSVLHVDDSRFLRVLHETFSHSVLTIGLKDAAVSGAVAQAERDVTDALQRILLPQVFQIPNAQVASNYRAAGISGGDWFGYHLDPVRRSVDFYMGDATGHGVKSAVLAAMASGAIYANANVSRQVDGFVGNDEERLERLARSVNRVICDAGRDEFFMSMLFVAMDLNTGKGIYLNAGHQPFYLVNALANKSKALMPAPGHALGFSKNPSFAIERFEMNPGDVLFLCSSGLFGNEGVDGRRLSVKRLKGVLEKSKDPLEIQNMVLDSANAIWKNEVIDDDVTTVVFKWLGAANAQAEETQVVGEGTVVSKLA